MQVVRLFTDVLMWRHMFLSCHGHVILGIKLMKTHFNLKFLLIEFCTSVDGRNIVVTFTKNINDDLLPYVYDFLYHRPLYIEFTFYNL